MSLESIGDVHCPLVVSLVVFGWWRLEDGGGGRRPVQGWGVAGQDRSYSPLHRLGNKQQQLETTWFAFHDFFIASVENFQGLFFAFFVVVANIEEFVSSSS